jgi:hypothetical protein
MLQPPAEQVRESEGRVPLPRRREEPVLPVDSLRFFEADVARIVWPRSYKPRRREESRD